MTSLGFWKPISHSSLSLRSLIVEVFGALAVDGQLSIATLGADDAPGSPWWLGP